MNREEEQGKGMMDDGRWIMTHMKLMCDSICIEKGPRQAMNAIRFTSFIHTSFSLEEEINGTKWGCV